MLDATFWLPGKPRPKGSWNVVPSKTTGRPVFVGPKGLKGWQRAATEAARVAWPWAPLEGAVAVDIVVHLARPKTVARMHPTSRWDGDGDKFERAVWDALTGVCFVDDAQVVEWTGRKVYTDGAPGVQVTVRLANA